MPRQDALVADFDSNHTSTGWHHELTTKSWQGEKILQFCVSNSLWFPLITFLKEKSVVCLLEILYGKLLESGSVDFFCRQVRMVPGLRVSESSWLSLAPEPLSQCESRIA